MSHVFGRAGIFRVTANRGCLDLGTSHAASLGSDDSTEARVAAGSDSDGAGSAAASLWLVSPSFLKVGIFSKQLRCAFWWTTTH